MRDHPTCVAAHPENADVRMTPGEKAVRGD
jgi:hypothetical protein